jgi:hypothetical protein
MDDLIGCFSKKAKHPSPQSSPPREEAGIPPLKASPHVKSLQRTGRCGAGIHIKHAILRNEPTVFCSDFGCNVHYMSNLRGNVTKNFGGFVFQNEPTGRVFLGGREGKWTQIGCENALRGGSSDPISAEPRSPCAATGEDHDGERAARPTRHRRSTQIRRS